MDYLRGNFTFSRLVLIVRTDTHTHTHTHTHTQTESQNYRVTEEDDRCYSHNYRRRE